VLPLGAEAAAKGLGVTRDLAATGIIAPAEVTGRSLKAGLKWAGKIGAQVAVIIGEAELEAASAIVRDLVRSEQQTVAVERVPEIVAGLFGDSKTG
jgi:histidyl-tRNA synthetase